MHETVQKLIEFYRTEQIDSLKENLTLSVATNKTLHRFNRGGAIFGLDEKPEDSYNLLRKNIVGGPSLVFGRYEKVNESFVDEDENGFVKSIVVYNYNAPYLFAMGGNILTVSYTVYENNPNEKLQPEKHRLQIAERDFVYFSTKQCVGSSCFL